MNSIRNPVMQPAQMSRPVFCRPMSCDWLEWQKSIWWSTKYEGNPTNDREAAQMQKMYLLREKLLSFGGEQACMQLFEPDLEKIMNRGQFFYGEHARKRKGRPNRCHQNAAVLWNANKESYKICTGYALSEDGLWRQHTWVVEPLKRSWRIWETTEKRVAYFGVILNKEECEQFFKDVLSY